MTVAKIRVTVDPQLCMGNALCAVFHEDLFELDDDGYADSPGVIPAAERDRIRDAIQNCPTRAISMSEVSG